MFRIQYSEFVKDLYNLYQGEKPYVCHANHIH